MKKFIDLITNSAFCKFLIPIGIVLIVVGSSIFMGLYSSRKYAKVVAIVSNIETVKNKKNYYNVYVEYEYDGMSYYQQYGTFSNYKKGDKVYIYCDLNNPLNLVKPTNYALPFIFIILGVLFLMLEIVNILKLILERKKIKSQMKGWLCAN